MIRGVFDDWSVERGKGNETSQMTGWRQYKVKEGKKLMATFYASKGTSVKKKLKEVKRFVKEMLKPL